MLLDFGVLIILDGEDGLILLQVRLVRFPLGKDASFQPSGSSPLKTAAYTAAGTLPLES